jgi:hypothetical protein
MARPSKLSKARAERIIAATRAGAPRHVAAQAAGIARSTLQSWIAKGEAGGPKTYRDFAADLRRAEADAEIFAVGIVRQAMRGDWKAAAWFLEHARPGYAKRHEVSGPDGEAIALAGGWDISKLSDKELRNLQHLAEKAERDGD